MSRSLCIRFSIGYNDKLLYLVDYCLVIFSLQMEFTQLLKTESFRSIKESRHRCPKFPLEELCKT